MAYKVDSCVFFVELLHFVWSETNGRRTEKIIQMGRIGRAGYRGYPRLARKHPYEGELRRSHTFALRPFADKCHERHVVFQRFRGVALVETAVLVDYTRKERTSQRAIGNEADA